jgi:hypothetical protein
MKFLKGAVLSIFLGLLILAGASTCTEIGHGAKGSSPSNGSFLDLGPSAQGNPKPADGQQAGDLKAAEPLFPRGLRINPPPPEGPPSPPSLPETTPPPIPKPKTGAINPRTGEYYPPVPGGVINPKSGEILPKVNGGYINPQTGEFIPAPK